MIVAFVRFVRKGGVPDGDNVIVAPSVLRAAAAELGVMATCHDRAPYF